MSFKKVLSLIYVFLLILASLAVPAIYWKFHWLTSSVILATDILILSLFVLNEHDINTELAHRTAELFRYMVIASIIYLLLMTFIVFISLLEMHLYGFALTLASTLGIIGAVVLAGKCVRELMR